MRQKTWQKSALSALCAGAAPQTQGCVLNVLPLPPQNREGAGQRKPWKSDEQTQKL